MMIPGGDFEIIDADFDVTEVSDDDAEENKRLKQAIREEDRQAEGLSHLAVPAEVNASTGDIMDSNSTVRMCLMIDRTRH